jgi:hypothetical protein
LLLAIKPEEFAGVLQDTIEGGHLKLDGVCWEERLVKKIVQAEGIKEGSSECNKLSCSLLPDIAGIHVATLLMLTDVLVRGA